MGTFNRKGIRMHYLTEEFDGKFNSIIQKQIKETEVNKKTRIPYNGELVADYSNEFKEKFDYQGILEKTKKAFGLFEEVIESNPDMTKRVLEEVYNRLNGMKEKNVADEKVLMMLYGYGYLLNSTGNLTEENKGLLKKMIETKNFEGLENLRVA